MSNAPFEHIHMCSFICGQNNDENERTLERPPHSTTYTQNMYAALMRFLSNISRTYALQSGTVNLSTYTLYRSFSRAQLSYNGSRTEETDAKTERSQFQWLPCICRFAFCSTFNTRLYILCFVIPSSAYNNVLWKWCTLNSFPTAVHVAKHRLILCASERKKKL